MSWWFGAEAAAQQSGPSSYTVPETAPALAMAGGAAHLTVARKHTAPNLSFTSGTQTSTKFTPVHEDAPNMRLLGGTNLLTVSRKLTSANLAMLGGAEHLAATRQHAAAHMSLAGGALALIVARKHVAPVITLTGGNSGHFVLPGSVPYDGRIYTTDEQPENTVGSTSRREPLRLARRRW